MVVLSIHRKLYFWYENKKKIRTTKVVQGKLKGDKHDVLQIKKPFP